MDGTCAPVHRTPAPVHACTASHPTHLSHLPHLCTQFRVFSWIVLERDTSAVRIEFDTQDPVLSLERGSIPPPVQAAITYNGTGRLVGRWEVVLPGEDPPTSDDLLTEATLPVELLDSDDATDHKLHTPSDAMDTVAAGHAGGREVSV